MKELKHFAVNKLKNPLYEEVAHILRRRILIKEMKPGEHLNEVSISRELNISRGPVRDAIKMLEKEGMVETYSNGRTMAVMFTKQSFQDWTRTRITLERFGIEEISRKQRVTKDDLNSIHQLIQQMQNLTDQQKDLDAFIELDLRFHRDLVALSGNSTLMILWNSIHNTLTTIMGLIAENYGSISKQTDMHQEILKRLLDHNYEGAALCMTTHIEEGEKAILSALQIQ